MVALAMTPTTLRETLPFVAPALEGRKRVL